MVADGFSQFLSVAGASPPRRLHRVQEIRAQLKSSLPAAFVKPERIQTVEGGVARIPTARVRR